MADFNSGLGLTNDNSGAPPTDTGTPPPSDSGTPPPSSGGFNWQQYLPTNMGGTGTGATAMAIPALATAYNQYQNADRYMNMVNGTRGVLDPFGTQRAQYATQLSNASADPAKYISSLPSYQAALQLGLGAVNEGSMSKTGGVPRSDDIAFAGQLGAQTWNTEANRLAGLAGANISPSAMASLYGMGIQGSVNSRNAALQSMFYPFFAQNGQGGGGPPTGGNTAPPPTGGGGQPPPFAGAIRPPPGFGGGSLNGDPTAPYGRDANGNPIDPNGGYAPGGDGTPGNYGDNPYPQPDPWSDPNYGPGDGGGG